MDANLTPEQQALFASIMGNNSQMANLNPVIPTQEEVNPISIPTPSPASNADNGRVLSQAEIDALIASMGN